MPGRELNWDVKRLIFDRIGYKPTPEQALIHFDEHRIREGVGGWRSGKSKMSSAELVAQHHLGDLFWLIGADYELCREEFGYLVEFFQTLEIIKNLHFPSRDQCKLVLEPVEGHIINIETKSAKYPERIAAKAPDGIILCEAAQLPPTIFDIVLGRLIEKDGWLFMAGTLETSLDWYAEKFNDYQLEDNPEDGKAWSLPSWSNTGYKGCPFPGGRDDAKIKKIELSCPPDLFSERYGGKPVKPKGLVIPEFKTSLHVGSFPIDLEHPIEIGVDPGYHPSAYSVVFLQFIGDDIFVVDEIYQQYKNNAQIILMTQKKPYYERIKGGAIDVTSQYHTSSDKPAYDIWRDTTKLTLDTRTIKPVNDGVERLRTFMLPHPVSGDVQLHIDSKCRGLISEFGGCKSPLENRGAWKKKMDKYGNVLSDEPEKTNCDAVKALIYAIVAHYGLVPRGTGDVVSHLGMW